MQTNMLLVSPNCADLFPANIEIGKFPDGNSHVRVLPLAKVKNQKVILLHRLYPNQNDAFMELLFILQELKNLSCRVVLLSPFLPYARHDKITLEGEIPAASTVCRLLAESGVEKLVTFDCHFLNMEGEAEKEGLKIKNISLGKLLIEQARKATGDENLVVVGPDQGAAYLAAQGGGQNLQKVRTAYQSGKVGYRHIEKMEGSLAVKGKNVLLLDDMISTGSTMLQALDKMLEAGAKKVVCAATHGLFLYDCFDRLRKRSDEVFASDTIPNAQARVFIKPILEDEIKREEMGGWSEA